MMLQQSLELSCKGPKDYFPWERNDGVIPWKKRDIKCKHEMCSQCHGSGIKKNGTPCIHMISCPCPSCNPYFC